MSLYDLNNIFLVLILLSIWALAIKGIALWTAARRKEKGWFIALLIINTLGILEVIYLLITKQEKVTPKHHTKTAFEALVEKEKQLTSRQQAILHILKGVLDDKQQATVSDEALHRAVTSIEERIQGDISQGQLQSVLDKQEAKGGAGLYKQTAEHIAAHVQAMIVATEKKSS